MFFIIFESSDYDPVQEYEKIHMIPAKVNHQAACSMMGELLSAIPEALGLKNFAKNLSICLLEDRLREAMMSVYLAISSSIILFIYRLKVF